jgi:hypothetical protein
LLRAEEKPAVANVGRLFLLVHRSSFRDGPKDQTRNLEIPGSMLRIALRRANWRVGE